MKTTAGFRLLAILLSLAAFDGMSDALGAPAPPFPVPVLPTRAATPPALEKPGGETIPGVPGGSPRNPKPAPLPAPAVTNNYAGPVTDNLKTGTTQHPWENEGGLVAAPVV